MRITLERAKEAEDVKSMAMNAAVQGYIYPDLRTYAARKLSEMNFEIHPIGAVVPLMEGYRYRDLVDVVIASKLGLRPRQTGSPLWRRSPDDFRLGGCYGN